MTRKNPIAIRTALPLACAAVVLAALSPQPADAGTGQALSVAAGAGVSYDDNFIHYSDDQLALYDSGLRPQQFAVRTTNDLLWNPFLAAEWEQGLGPGRWRSVRVKASGELHQDNGTSDFHSIAATGRQSFGRDRILSLGTYVLPGYYLRQLYDADPAPPSGLPGYRRADFDLKIGSLSWHQRVARSTGATVSYQYEQRSYNQYFRERDSGTHQAQMSVGWTRLPHRGAIQASGGYRVSHARGRDGSTSPGTTPTEADVSYHGIIAGLGGRVDVVHREGWRLGTDLSFELNQRAYDSDRPSDVYHYGRHDLGTAIEMGARFSYMPHWSLRGFYRYEANQARLSTNAPPTSDAGDFHDWQTGLAFQWSGTIWRGSASTPEAEAGP